MIHTHNPPSILNSFETPFSRLKMLNRGLKKNDWKYVCIYMLQLFFILSNHVNWWHQTVTSTLRRYSVRPMVSTDLRTGLRKYIPLDVTYFNVKTKEKANILQNMYIQRFWVTVQNYPENWFTLPFNLFRINRIFYCSSASPKLNFLMRKLIVCLNRKYRLEDGKMNATRQQW